MKSCINCANKKKIGGVIRCDVTGRIKSPPFKACDNWVQGMTQVTLEDIE